MTIKKLAVLGSVLAGAVLLQNKERRDRLMRSANELINNARHRLGRTAENLSEQAQEVASEVQTGGFGETESSAQTYAETVGDGGNRSGIY